jgi:hypothetical protein
VPRTMLENDGSKLVQHIFPYTLSLYYYDAQLSTAMRRLLLLRFAALHCQLHRCVYSVATVMPKIGEHRA